MSPGYRREEPGDRWLGIGLASAMLVMTVAWLWGLWKLLSPLAFKLLTYIATL